MHIKKLLILMLLSTQLFAVNLENWRAPFYKIAVEQSEVQSSPSGLFWDDLKGTSTLFSKELWPDSELYERDYWIIEPALRGELSNDEFLSGDNYNLHFDIYSNFKYGPLTVRTVLDVDRDYTYDTKYPWKKDRGAAGTIQEAYLQVDNPIGFLRFGRLKREWGPFPQRSITLSNNPFAYDGLEWQLALPFLEFRYLFTAFSDKQTSLDLGGDSRRIDRYLVAHSLNFILGKYGAIGVTETALFGQEHGFVELKYVNPVSIYSVVNTNGEAPANLMLGFQGWFHPFFKKINIKAQILFDDFQVDNEDAADQEPTHWACDFGFYWTDFSPLKFKHHFTFEYSYLSRWLYTVSDPNTLKGEKYTYLGKSLGSSNIDGDKILGEFTIVGDNFWVASLGLSLVRQDTNTVDTKWNSDGALGYRKEVKLSERKTVTSTLSNHYKIMAYFKDYADLSFIFANRWIKERAGANKYIYDPSISLQITAHYSGAAIKFKKRDKK